MAGDIRRSASPSTSAPGSGLFESIARLVGTVRGLIADGADLVAAEAHAALHMVISMVVLAVGMGVLAAAALLTIIALIAVILVEQGISWPWALAGILAACVIATVIMGLRLKSMFGGPLFVATRRQLRGVVNTAQKAAK